MSSLERLRERLDSVSSTALQRPWREDHSIDQHIDKLTKLVNDGGSGHIPRDIQQRVLETFWSSRLVNDLKEARLLAYGISLPLGAQRIRVIEDASCMTDALDSIEKFSTAPKQFRRCYQGLIYSYFGYDPESKETPEIGRRNWIKLRHFLREQAPKILDETRNPPWVHVLEEHVTLLTEKPCERYGADYLDGRTKEVDDLRQVLNVADSTWMMRKLLLAQIVAAITRKDSDFLAVLPVCLRLLRGNIVIRDEGLGLILDRHAQLSQPPIVPQLCDAAVEWWGNPWLERNSMRWGRATKAARSMVTEWLKLEFIHAFFTLLAEEGTGDTRRLEFWKKYVHEINEIHFALGTNAMYSRAPDFVTLRKKMTGLVVPLHDTARDNNAFIMKMGRLVIVEFSGYSNACYAYDATTSLSFVTDQPVVMRVDAPNSLKHSTRQFKLSHQDGVLGWTGWEGVFSERLKHYGISQSSASRRAVLQLPERDLQIPKESRDLRDLAASSKGGGNRIFDMSSETPADLRPAIESSTPNWSIVDYSRKALIQLANEFALTIQDFTIDNGNLWVRALVYPQIVEQVLLRWGFRFKENKGWWKTK